jgi:protease-4
MTMISNRLLKKSNLCNFLSNLLLFRVFPNPADRGPEFVPPRLAAPLAAGRFICLLALAVFLSGCVYISLPRAEPLAEKAVGGKGPDKVLLMDVSGLIEDEAGNGVLGLEARPNITARIKEELVLASEDSRVKAVVLRINSPGGSVTTCDIIAHELKEFKKKRGIPVVAELMDVAASGGYYVAVSADRIVAHPTTVTGSIGVVAYGVNASGLMEKVGISDQTVKSGGNKDMGSPLRPMTEGEREILKTVVDGMHERFLDVIIEGRAHANLGRDELAGIADGRIYTARQALDLKLIDSIGYMDDAIALAREIAGIKEATVITYAPVGSYRNNLYSGLLSQGPSAFNLFNLDAGALSGRLKMRFMYLWMP